MSVEVLELDVVDMVSEVIVEVDDVVLVVVLHEPHIIGQVPRTEAPKILKTPAAVHVSGGKFLWGPQMAGSGAPLHSAVVVVVVDVAVELVTVENVSVVTVVVVEADVDVVLLLTLLVVEEVVTVVPEGVVVVVVNVDVDEDVVVVDFGQFWQNTGQRLVICSM